ncbi:MAG: putative peroxidase-related enzyme [Verrucomicrobiales bacterium]
MSTRKPANRTLRSNRKSYTVLSMPRFPSLEEETATPEVAAILSDFRQKMGFPIAPNFIRTQGAAPSVARGTWGVVENVLCEGALPRSLKEMMFVAISKDRNCNYCEAAHIACCKMLGVDQMEIDAVVEDVASVQPARVRDLIQFSVKCARSPQSLTDEDFASLRAHGLGEPEIIEVIAMSALAVYANTIADATQVEADSIFSEF